MTTFVIYSCTISNLIHQRFKLKEHIQNEINSGHT